MDSACCMVPWDYAEKPWIIGGGAAKLMAAESEAIKRDLIEQGMDPKKIVVTGKPGLDAIAEQLQSVSRAEKRKALGIPEHAKVILCSIPQLAEHDLLPWDRHKQEMEFLFKTMTATGAYVLLSLHPKKRPHVVSTSCRCHGCFYQ